MENVGTLIASGFIAGEAVTGVLLAALVLAGVPSLTYLFSGQQEFAFVHTVGGWLSLAIFFVGGDWVDSNSGAGGKQSVMLLILL